MSAPHWPRRLALAIALASCVNVLAAAQDSALRLPDHYEFDAQLSARFAPDADGSRAIRLAFDYPAAGDATLAAWQLDIVDARGQVLRRWIGEQGLRDGRGHYSLRWDGLDDAGQRPAAGFYTLRLRAVPSVAVATEAGQPLFERVKSAFALGADELIDQRLDVRVGNVRAPKMPAFAGLPRGRDGQRVAATAGLPFDVYYGNMHSQTNHSDGGTPVSSCGGSEVPQGGLYGPADAYAMMDTQAGGDFLLASEHNHMYDGSTSTNTSATPASANNLFASGKSAASAYSSAHADFLALYGNEWGVISNGGHLNLINPDALPSWEYNSSNQLIGAVATIKSNYADLYATMKLRGWIGQFNHPSSSQFAIGGTGMAYNADGAEVMVLAEIMNSSAFSTNTSETETGRSTYEGAFNTLLERGYKVAPATNQDNHCANWGLSFRNRTGVLLPSGAALNTTNFLDALKARRAFASEDKNAQLVLTGNGQLMGQTLRNSGALTLVANYASASGGSVARVQFFEGVPRRNGTVTQLFEGAGSYSFTPAAGEHFYYVKVTEADGDRLWSAPIWIIQDVASSDTTAPTVSASESGSSGTITLSATASDNVGVTKVEFYVDGALKGTDTSSPYSMTLDSTTLGNGSHSLTAKAFDAAGNSATSSAASFSINNPVPDTTAPTVSASESGSSGTITLSASASDNVGVTKVEFYVDGALKGTDTSSPYSMTLDSTTLGNGSHSLTAKAFDAAGNSATSSAASFSINNPVPDSEALKGTDTSSPYSMTLDSTTLGSGSHSLTAKAFDAAGNSATSSPVGFSISNSVERLLNGGFESGSSNWTATSGVIDKSSSPAARSGIYKAWLNGYGSSHTDTLYQTVSIPSTVTSATLSFWLRVTSDETTTTTAYDTLKVQVRNSSNTVLATLATYSNLNKGSSYVQRTFDVTAYKGQTIRVYFLGVEGTQVATSFLIDDVSLSTR